MTRGFRLKALAFTALLAFTSLRAQEGAPSSADFIPVSIGQADAAGGKLSLSIPMGPVLPGRMALGFRYQSEVGGGATSPGTLEMISWPTMVEDPTTLAEDFYSAPTRVVRVFGKTLTSYPWVTVPGAPTLDQVIQALQERGFPFAAITADLQDPSDPTHYDSVIPSPWTYVLSFSSDGKSAFLTGERVINYLIDLSPRPVRKQRTQSFSAVMDGSRCIWAYGFEELKFPFYKVNHITDRFGNHVSVTYSGGSYPKSWRKVVILDEQFPTNVITAELSTPTYSKIGHRTLIPAVITVINSFGEPSVTIQGDYREVDGYYRATEYIWTVGLFRPSQWTERATDGQTRAWTFAWASDLSNLQVMAPNGLKEVFEFAGPYCNLDAYSPSAFDQKTGQWIGWRLHFSAEGSTTAWVPSGGLSMIRRYLPDGNGEAYVIRRLVPRANWPNASINSWQEPSHKVAVMRYGTPVPMVGTDPYRGRILTYPSARSWTDGTSPEAYLFVTSALLAEETIAGTAVGPGGSDLPTNYQRLSLTLFDGWSVRSWSNPGGMLGVPMYLSAVAQRTRVYLTGAPTRTLLAGIGTGAWDAWGPVFSQEFLSSTVETPALPTGETPTAWASAIAAPSADLVRTGRVTRERGPNLGNLRVLTDTKTLEGSALSTHRQGATSPLVTTLAYTYDNLDRTTKKTRTEGAFTETEEFTYEANLPLVKQATVSRFLNGAKLEPNPAQPGKIMGTVNTYDASSARWLASETDLITSKEIRYTRDAQGRETSREEWLNGIRLLRIFKSYDTWGRVQEETREAQGDVAALTSSFTSDAALTYRSQTVAGLTTTSTFDALGRVVKVVQPGGSSYQQTRYNGWGDRVAESPMLRANEPYGESTYGYDPFGRLNLTTDVFGRIINQVTQFSTWQTRTVEGVTITAFWSETKDDRNNSRATAYDRLGQKVALVDEAGQLSQFGYSRWGRLAWTNQGGQGRSYTYDDAGHLLSRMEPEEGASLFSNFTAKGIPLCAELKGLSGGSSAVTTTTLNTFLAPETIQNTWAGRTVTRTLTYDSLLRLQSLFETQPFGSLSETYGYDGLGRLNQKTTSDGVQAFTVARTLDELGRTVRLSYPAAGGRPSQVETFEYDAFGRPVGVKIDGATRGTMQYGLTTSHPTYGTIAMERMALGNGASTEHHLSRGQTMATVQNAVATPDFFFPGSLRHELVWSAGGLLTQRGQDTFEYDALGRLTSARTVGFQSTEMTAQIFGYDRWGNRTSNQVVWAGPKPDEPLSWTAAYDARNRLPGSVMTSSGALLTGAAYDDLGRMTEVWAIPGQTASATAWGYDGSGRVLEETVNGQRATFLLDGEGLRFKRMKADGSVQYTVYGFGREPLSTFEKKPAVVTLAQTLTRTATARQGASGRASTRGPIGEPVGAYIDAPVAGTILYAGQAVSFQGDSDLGTTFNWTFGDGTTASGRSPVKTYAIPGTYTVTLRTGGGGAGTVGSVRSRVYTVAVAKPVISSFTAAPATIALGAGSSLSWTVSGATSLSLDNGIGAVTGTTSRAVSPTATTVYTLSATNAGGTVTSTVIVTVVQPPSISSFYASPASIYQGDGSTLYWAVSGATSLSLDNGIGAVSGGSRGVSPSATTSYTLTATNTVNGVSVSRSASATVYVSPRPTVPSIDAFTADASAIAAGAGTTLRWSVSNSVGSVSVSLSNVGSVGASGVQWVVPASTLTYTLTATNTLDPAKSVSRDVMVTVVNLPVITFGANPETINVGSSSTLSWSVGNNPTSVSISPGIGTVGGSGSIVVSPGTTTTYTLTASNLAGTVSKPVTVYVTQKPVIVSFTASPSQINQGGSTTLSWSTQGATGLTVNGTPVGGTSLLVAPTTTTTYILVATNSAGSASAPTQVTVVIPESYLWKKTLVYGFGTLITEERPDGPVYVQGDQVGSPNILTNASGAVVGRSKNLPFGERFGSLGVKSARRYTNHEDQEGSAIYMQARTYLPAYGRFAQVDPIYDQTKDDPQTWNLYNYCANNPVTKTDPDGRGPQGADSASRVNPEYGAEPDIFEQMYAMLRSEFRDGLGRHEYHIYLNRTTGLPYGQEPPEEQAAPTTQEAQTSFTDAQLAAAKGRMVQIADPSQIADIDSAVHVLISLGIWSSSIDKAIDAVAGFLSANPTYEGNVAVVQSNHGLYDAAMNHITGGWYDPVHLGLVQAAASAVLDVNKGGRVAMIGHSDGSTALDRALGNLGVQGSRSLSVNYFGSPMTHSSVDNVHWTVRNRDLVTWGGSFWRFGFSDTQRLGSSPGSQHDFSAYMRDAGAVW